MRRLLLLIPLFGAVIGAEEGPGAEAALADGKAIVEHIKWLSDDERKGRAAGSEGAISASDYIAAHFKRLVVEAERFDGLYFLGRQLRAFRRLPLRDGEP